MLHICAVIMYHEYLFNFVVQFVSNTVLCLSYKYFFLCFILLACHRFQTCFYFHMTVSPGRRDPSSHIPRLFQTEFVLKKIKYFFPMEKAPSQYFLFLLIIFLCFFFHFLSFSVYFDFLPFMPTSQDKSCMYYK